MDILIYPDPFLRKSADLVEDPGEVEKHIEEMLRTMYENKGVGLAATQVGIDERFFIMNTRQESDNEQVLINPKIVSGKGEVMAPEGCLSLPGIELKIPRYEWVLVRATGLDGEDVELEGGGLFARAVQHELDHLAGTLIIDKASLIARIAIKRRLKELEHNYHGKP